MKFKRHVIVKAEHGAKGANPLFVVSPLDRDDREVYEQLYCARGETEYRIKEQMQFFSDRTSACHGKHFVWPGHASRLPEYPYF